MEMTVNNIQLHRQRVETQRPALPSGLRTVLMD